jgi:hypothetical protein
MLFLQIPSLYPSLYTTTSQDPILEISATLSLGFLYASSGKSAIAGTLFRQFLADSSNSFVSSGNLPEYRFQNAYASSIGIGFLYLGLGDEPNSKTSFFERMKEFFIECIDFRISHLKSKSEASLRLLKGSVRDKKVLRLPSMAVLGLIYLKTGNKGIAEKLRLGNLLPISKCHPKEIVFSIISRFLILWDSIEMTELFFKTESEVAGFSKLQQYIASSALIFIYGLKFMSTCSGSFCLAKAKELILQLENLTSLDLHTVTSLLLACYGIGLLYCGSGNLESLRIIRAVRLLFLKSKIVTSFHFAALHHALGILFLGGCSFHLVPDSKCLATCFAFLASVCLEFSDIAFGTLPNIVLASATKKPQSQDDKDMEFCSKSFWNSEYQSLLEETLARICSR